MALSFVQVHGTIMILAALVFCSTGLLFARYGRSIRFGNRRQLLGKAVWFQIHRFFLSANSLLVLIGFCFILIAAGGKWVDPDVLGPRYFAHSIIGGTIVCCNVLQIWLALYRCNPQSRFRFIFDWSHRIVGITAFALTFPNIFIMSTLMTKRPNLLPIISCWAGWIVIVVIIFEKIKYQQKAAVTAVTNQENNNGNQRPDIELGINTNFGSRRHNQIKLLVFLIHILVSIVLAVSLIVFVCQ